MSPDTLLNNSLSGSEYRSLSGGSNRGERRPKLLFLAWMFPPARGIGSVRTWNIAKHLSRLGWDVTVVTPHPDMWLYVDNAEKTEADLAAEGIRRIVTDHHWRFLAPDQLKSSNGRVAWMAGGICRRVSRRVGIDRAAGWNAAAEHACGGLRSADVDLILCSGGPFAAFALAKKLSLKLSRPYVLDYRDPWEILSAFPVFQRMVPRREAPLVEASAAITTVSPSWASQLDARYKVGSKVHVVTNGYDEEELAGVSPNDFGHFAMVFAGTLYPPEIVLTPILAALKRLREKGTIRDCRFHYYGSHSRHVQEEAVRLNVADLVKVYGNVPRSEALAAVRGANIAVVVSSIWQNPEGRTTGCVPGKLYEVIGSRTPVIVIAPPNTDVASIAQSTGLAHCVIGSNVDGIVNFIEEVLCGKTFTERNVESFSWSYLAKKFDQVLREFKPAHN